VAETELRLHDVARLHALEHLLGVQPDATDELERADAGVAVDAELGLDRTTEVLLLDTEQDIGCRRGRGGSTTWKG
jgi:hypothetical protein